MLQVRSLVLYFFLLVLQVSFDFTLDIINKRGGLSKTLLKESFKFVLSKDSNLIPLNLSLVLLPMEVDSISEKQSFKKNMLIAHGTGNVKIIFTFLDKSSNTLYVSFYNLGQSYSLLGLSFGRQNLFGYILDPQQTILKPTWWLSTGLHQYIYLANQERKQGSRVEAES